MTGQLAEGPAFGPPADKTAQLNRLRRIEGQVRGLQRMVQVDASCIEVLTQVSAATRALESVALVLLEDHLRRCLTEADTQQVDLDEKITEAAAAIARLVRS